MEVDPISPERNSDQVPAGGISSEPTQHQQVRSYECTFCKRGFSNAQALGGHMNIHRRDRAKLKEPSSPITRKNSSSPPFLPAISTEPSFLELEPSEDNIRQPWPTARELRQLQLFSERPSSSHKSDSDERTTQVTTDTSSDNKELDLELRLGHDS